MKVQFETITPEAVTTLFAIARKDRVRMETIGFPEGSYDKEEIINVLNSIQEGNQTCFDKVLVMPDKFPDIYGLFKMNIIHPDGSSTGAMVFMVRDGETYAEAVATELYRMCANSLKIISGFFVRYTPMECGEFIKSKNYSRAFVVARNV